MVTQHYGLTGLTYDRGGPVPYPGYRCQATAQERPGHTHLCRHVRDHGEDHGCICGTDWQPVAA